MAKILLIGDICAERQYFLNEVPAINEVGIVNNANFLTSSKIINAGRILAAKNDVSIFGVVGKDENGRRALEDLSSYAINGDLVYKVDKPTDEVLVFTDKNGQVSIVLYPSTKDAFDTTQLDITGHDFIYTATSIPLEQLYMLIQRAKEKGVDVFLDIPNQQSELKLVMLQSVAFVVPNRREAELLLNTTIDGVSDGLKAAQELKKYIEGNVVITLDKDGCIVFAKDWDKPQHFPSIPTEVIDTTGAGDIFRGVLLREYIKTNDITKSIQKALDLSAKSVTIKGVDNSINFVNNLE